MKSDSELFLQVLRLKGATSAYTLSHHESPQNALSQQVRAINLVHALQECGIIREKSRIGIVGAGIAGTTAAAYALSKGCAVTILEKADGPLKSFASSTRYLPERSPHMTAKS